MRNVLIGLSSALVVASTIAIAGCSDYGSDDEETGGAGAVPGTGGGGATNTGGAGATNTGGGGAANTGGTATATCDSSVTPCETDAVGTWNVTSACLKVSGTMDLTALGLNCKSAEITDGTIDVTGTWTNEGNSTYTDETHVTGTETIELPATCKEISGTVTTCDGITIPFAAGLGYYAMTCVDNTATDGCTCTATIDQNGGLGVAPMVYPYVTGNYTTTGGTLTVTPDEQEYLYCVEGGTNMVLTPKSVGKTGTVTGMVVLQKQ